MVNRVNGENLPLELDIEHAEGRTGLVFPRPLRTHFNGSAGGIPELPCFENDRFRIVLHCFLSLALALETYSDLVEGRSLVERHYFPIAEDEGGDFLFVDTKTDDARVWMYRHDTAFENLKDVGCGLGEFLSALRPELSEWVDIIVP